MSLRTQCELLGVRRESLDYEPAPVSAEDLKIMRMMDEIYLRDPCNEASGTPALRTLRAPHLRDLD